MAIQSSAIDAPRRARPIGARYVVRLSAVPEKHPSGLWLPAELRDQYTEGVVEARGWGWPIPEKPEVIEEWWPLIDRAVMWVGEGERVLFQRHDLQLFDDREKLGVVHGTDLLGIVRRDGELDPLNDWVLLEFLERVTERQSGLAVIAKKAQRPHCGAILRWGPGELRTTGPLAGLSRRVPTIMGFEDEDRDLAGMRVHFGRLSGVLDLYHANSAVECWLIRAGKIECVEIED